MGATLDAWAVSRRSRCCQSHVTDVTAGVGSVPSDHRPRCLLDNLCESRIERPAPQHQPIGLRRRAVPQLRSSLRMSMREAPPKKRTRGSRSWIRFADMVPVNRVAQMRVPSSGANDPVSTGAQSARPAKCPV